MMHKGTPFISEDSKESFPIEVLDARYLNTGEKFNSDLNLGGNKIVNVKDSEDIVTKTYIENNLESRRRYVDNQLSSKVDKTLFETELAKKVKLDVYTPALNLLLNNVENRVALAQHQQDLATKVDVTYADANYSKKTDVSSSLTEIQRSINALDTKISQAKTVLESRLSNIELSGVTPLQLTTELNKKVNIEVYNAMVTTQLNNQKKMQDDIDLGKTKLRAFKNDVYKLEEGRIDENVMIDGTFKKIVLKQSSINGFIIFHKVLFERNDNTWHNVHSKTFINAFGTNIMEVFQAEFSRDNLNTYVRLVFKYGGEFPSGWTKRFKVFYSI